MDQSKIIKIDSLSVKRPSIRSNGYTERGENQVGMHKFLELESARATPLEIQISVHTIHDEVNPAFQVVVEVSFLVEHIHPHSLGLRGYLSPPASVKANRVKQLLDPSDVRK